MWRMSAPFSCMCVAIALQQVYAATLAEIVGVRLLLVNVLRPLAAGEKLAPEAFDKMLDQISEVKHELAAKLQQQAARKKPQPEKPSGEGKR